MGVCLQCTWTHQASSYLVARRREFYIRHLPPSVSDSQKKRLASASPFTQELFDPQILEKVTSEFKGDIATSAQVTLSGT